MYLYETHADDIDTQPLERVIKHQIQAIQKVKKKHQKNSSQWKVLVFQVKLMGLMVLSNLCQV
jgi:hypothetical protein